MISKSIVNKRVLVFGSYVTDLCGRTDFFPTPGETVKGNSFKLGPGGKGSNQAVAAKRAGAEVTFITKLGNDTLGKEAIEFYRSEEMYNENILIDEKESTGVALITVNENTSQNQIIVIGGACENFTEGDMSNILEQVEQSDILLTQLETNMKPVEKILKHAKNHGVMTVLNPAPAQLIDNELYQYVDIITPNETEVHTLLDVEVVDEASAEIAALKFIEKGVEKVVITMGEKGAYAHDGKNKKLYNTVCFESVVDTTGAGDAFSGGLVAALSRGMDFPDAVVYGSTVAGLAITKYGTAPAMPYREKIDAVFNKAINVADR